MKIRQGFVSNSSSASFLIYGIELYPRMFLNEDLIGLARKRVDILDKKIERAEERGISWLVERHQEDKDELVEAIENNDIQTLHDIIIDGQDIDIMEDLIIDTNLEFESVMGERNFVGKDPTKIPDNVTMGEWKESVKAEIRQLFPNVEDKEFDWHEECWRDG